MTLKETRYLIDGRCPDCKGKVQFNPRSGGQMDGLCCDVDEFTCPCCQHTWHRTTSWRVGQEENKKVIWVDDNTDEVIEEG